MKDLGGVLKNRVGIVVWGIGDHARRTVLPAINKVSDLHLVGIGSRNLRRIQAEAEKYNCQAVGALQELVCLAGVDVVYVATPIGCHVSDVTTALSYGKHVWCEKAFTQNLDEAVQLVKNSKKFDKAICVSCAPLYHPAHSRLISLLGDGCIGSIHAIDAHFGFPHVDQRHSKYDPEVGGGALLDVGFYPLVLGSSLLPERAIVTSALVETETEYRVDTAGTALLRFPSGGHLTSRWGYGRDYINEIRVFGETGELRISPAFSKPSALMLKMQLRRQNRIEEVFIPERNQFVEMLNAFVLTIEDPMARELHREQAVKHQQLLCDVYTFCTGKR